MQCTARALGELADSTPPSAAWARGPQGRGLERTPLRRAVAPACHLPPALQEWGWLLPAPPKCPNCHGLHSTLGFSAPRNLRLVPGKMPRPDQLGHPHPQSSGISPQLRPRLACTLSAHSPIPWAATGPPQHTLHCRGSVCVCGGVEGSPPGRGPASPAHYLRD